MKCVMAVAAAMLAAGCAFVGPTEPAAVADLAPTKGNAAMGRVTFTPQAGQMRVVAEVSGLQPGSHGFHIHEKGDCSAADGTSAGGHFNPLGKPHAGPGSGERHAGDMPMLVADASGNARLDVVLDTLTVGGGPTDVLGRGVIVHKDADDFKTQPTGNSGARVACGVIRSR